MYKHTFNLHQDVKQICVQPLKAIPHLPALWLPPAPHALLCTPPLPLACSLLLVFLVLVIVRSLSPATNPSPEGELMVTSPSSDALTPINCGWFIYTIESFSEAFPSTSFLPERLPALRGRDSFITFLSWAPHGTCHNRKAAPDTPGRLHVYHIWHCKK